MSIDDKIVQLRKDLLNELAFEDAGYPGACLSTLDILFSLYYYVMDIRPKHYSWDGRDRFIMCKEHCRAALYTILADRKYFGEEGLEALHQLIKEYGDKNLPGVESDAGSSLGRLDDVLRFAAEAKESGAEYRVYALMGDDDYMNPDFTEKLSAASEDGLDSLTVIMDHNMDSSADTAGICASFEEMGFDCRSTAGNSDSITNALEASYEEGKPRFICCETFFGEGLPSIQFALNWDDAAVKGADCARLAEELG
ncbi:MAG: hypothetical protein ACOX68_00910 [Candidatus Limivicinus sp.]